MTWWYKTINTTGQVGHLTLRDSKRFPTKMSLFSDSAADRVRTMAFCMNRSACSPVKLTSRPKYDLMENEAASMSDQNLKKCLCRNVPLQAHIRHQLIYLNKGGLSKRTKQWQFSKILFSDSLLHLKYIFEAIKL